jgi:urease accessory protein
MNAQLHIQVADRAGFSYLKKAYFTTPLKVANVTEDKTAPTLHLTMMSASPGILDGDAYAIKIEVEANCALQLQTQAYQRLFKMKTGATQTFNVHLEKNSSFCFLPHPSVPHEESIFTTENNFFITANTQFIFGEVLTCGRKLNGEVFIFSKYHSITKIYVDNKLTIKENLLMQPALINVNSIGQLEGYTHQASLVYLQPAIDCNQLKIAISALVAIEKNIEVGSTMAPINGLIIRLLGNGAEQLHHCLQKICALIQSSKSVAHVS